MNFYSELIKHRISLFILHFLLIFSSLFSPMAFAKPGGGGGGGAPSCTISSPQNDPIPVTTGGSALFQGVVSGGTPPYDVTWTFEGGDDGLAPPPSGGSDTAIETLQNSGDVTEQYDVAFYDPGTFTVTLSRAEQPFLSQIFK